MSTSNSGAGRPSKVIRIIDEYDLDGIGDLLVELWTADDPDERESLRSLADRFNQRVLGEALDDVDEQLLDQEIENVYRILTEDDVSVADRTRIERRLERQGIDVDALRSDFVSYQAIRTYLTKHREAEYSRDDEARIERTEEHIQRLRSRTGSVTESNIERLRNSGDLSVGSFHVTVDVRIICDDCGSQLDVGELIDRGGCDCSE